MRILLSICWCCMIWVESYSQSAVTVSDPDGHVQLNILVKSGIPVYSVSYNGKVMLEDSLLGLVTNEGDFSSNMELAESVTGKIIRNTPRKKSKARMSSTALTR